MYLKSDMNQAKIHVQEMTNYLREELRDYKMSENFIERYDLEKLSESSLDDGILNQIEEELISLHVLLKNILLFIDKLRKNFNPTVHLEQNDVQQLESFCTQNGDGYTGYNNLHYFCKRYTSLSTKNEESEFYFDSDEEGRVLMKGMYVIMDFQIMEQFYLDILKKLENDFI